MYLYQPNQHYSSNSTWKEDICSASNRHQFSRCVCVCVCIYYIWTKHEMHYGKMSNNSSFMSNLLTLIFMNVFHNNVKEFGLKCRFFFHTENGIMNVKKNNPVLLESYSKSSPLPKSRFHDDVFKVLHVL